MPADPRRNRPSRPRRPRSGRLLPAATLAVSVLALAPGAAEAQPAKVEGVMVTPGYSELVVTWDEAQGNEGYRVQWSESETFADDARGGGDLVPTGTTYTITGTIIPGDSRSRQPLEEDVEYFVRVQGVVARAGGAPGLWSDTAGPTTLLTLSQVTGMTVTDGERQLSVSWTAATGATGYKVQWKSGAQSYDPGTRQATVSSGTSYDIPSLTANTEYTVRVIATRNNADDGPPSAEATGRPYGDRGITVTPAALQVDENGGRATYTLVLDAPPGDPETVTITPSSRNANIATIRTDATNNGLVFDINNWRTPQTVTVTGVNNDIEDPNRQRTVTIRHSVSSVRGLYGIVARPDVTVTVTDDDTPPSVTLSETSVTVAEAGGTATYTAVLDFRPTEDVTITLTSTDPNAAAVSPTPLTFTTGNWDTPRTVTVTGVSDTNDNPDNQRMARITHAAAGGGYDDTMVDDVTVTVRDVDASELAIAGTRAPEGEDLTFTVMLSPVNDDEVTVRYADAGTGSATVGTDYTAIPGGTFTFEPGETSKTITVTVAEDTDVEPDETVVLMLSDVTGHAVISSDAASATGTIANDDTRFMVGDADTTINGHAVSITGDADVPEGIGFDLPILTPADLDGFDAPLTLHVSLDSSSPPDPADDGFALGEVAGDRTPLIDIDAVSLPSVVRDRGLEVCLPVSAGLVQEAGEAGQQILLLRYDGTNWREAGEAGSSHVEGGRLVCATGVTAFAPFAVGYVSSALSEQEVEDVAVVLAAVARTLASDAVDVVGGRFDASPAGGTQMTLAGHALRLTDRATADGALSAGYGMTGPDTRRLSRAAFGEDAGHALVSGGWRSDPMGEASWRGAGERELSERDLLIGSSFELPLGASGGEGGPAWTAWGRGAASGFSSSPEPGFSLDGELYSGYLGVEVRPQPSALLGVALSHSDGTVDYERTGEDESRAEIDVRLTSVLPYMHWRPRSGLGLWGLFGAGAGEMEFRRVGDDDEPVKTDLASYLGAVGARQELSTWRGMDLAVKADAFATTVRSEANEEENVPAVRGDAGRVRMLLEGGWELAIGPESRLSPRVEFGGRWDGGTAEGGLGVELGGGVEYTHAVGLSVGAQGRYLVAHEEGSFDEWGASVNVSLDPGVAGRGASLTVAPVWGRASSGTERLWGSAGALDQLGDAGSPGAGWTPQHLDVALEYGLPLSWDRGMVTPYGGMTLGSSAAARYRLGSRLTLNPSLNLSVEGNRTERVRESASHGVTARLGWHW